MRGLAMKTRMSCWGAVAAIAAMMLLGSGAGAQTTNCTLAYSSLTTCLSYVQGNDTTPPPQCCSGISYVNTNDAGCLCHIVDHFNSTTTSGVNATKAFALPSQCDVVVDTVKCFAVSVRPGSPSPSTPRTPVPTPTTPRTPVPGGGGTQPSPVDGSPVVVISFASVAAPCRDLFVAFTALLAVTHLVWNALTAT